MTKYNTTDGKNEGTHGVIYCITNQVNGKKYVGLTTKAAQERFEEHCKADSSIGSAIREHGKKNMQLEVLDVASEHGELCDLEMMWIDTLSSYKNGYNDTLGGEGVVRLRLVVELNERQERYIDFLRWHYAEYSDALNEERMYQRYVLSSIAWYYLSQFKSAKTKFAKLIMNFPEHEREYLLSLNLVDETEFFAYAKK